MEGYECGILPWYTSIYKKMLHHGIVNHNMYLEYA